MHLVPPREKRDRETERQKDRLKDRERENNEKREMHLLLQVCVPRWCL
jgi:hypothetical protein